MKQRTRTSSKSPTANLRQGVKPAPAKPQNIRLNVQTRKVLTQHYRAKYGIK